MDIQNNKLTYEFPKLNGEAKLRELILYIADKCADAPKFGATKLNKILYFSDFLWYRQTGKPITGIKYMRLSKGPAPQRMVPIREQMVANGDILVIKREFPNHPAQQRVIAREKANLDEYFTPGQIAFVDEVIRILWDVSADEASDASHGMAWKVYNIDRELIPYEAALLSDENITASDVERTGELSKHYGW